MTCESAKVVTSPTSRFSATSLSRRRMILPERVLGSSSTIMILAGLAIGPISLPTWLRSSATMSSPASALPRRITNAHTACPVVSSTGQAVCAFVILRGNADAGEDIVAELRNHVGREIGPIAKPAKIMIVDELPKTRSGKIMRRLLKDVAENREVGDVTTLADSNVMALIKTGLASGSGEG